MVLSGENKILSDENKILLLILLVVVAFWFFSEKTCDKKKVSQSTNSKMAYVSNNFHDNIDTREHFDTQSNLSNNDSASGASGVSGASSSSSFSKSVDSGFGKSMNSAESENSSNFSAESNDFNISQEMVKNNSLNAQDGYKSASYSKGDRGSKSNNLDKFFDGSYLKTTDHGLGFSPMIENDIGAAYTAGKPQKLSEKDKFDPDSLLPREKNNDWVDDPYEQVNVKSSSLANIFRPVGINSVQSTKKLGSHDIRGVPKAPKFNVAPWNNSSVDGDTNIRNDALCL